MASTIPVDLRPAFKEAKELLLEKKNLGEARRVLASIPDAEEFTQFHTAMSKIASLEGDDQLALAHVERAHALSPEDILIIARLAKLFIKLDRNEDALNYLNKAYDQGIKSKKEITIVSTLYSSLGVYHRAQSLIEVGIEKNPNDPRLRRSMAVCLLKTNNIAGAEAELDACLRMAPTNHSAIVMLSEIYIQKSLYSKAITLLRSADNDTCPEKLHGRVLLNLSEAYMQSSSIERSKKELLRIKNKSGIRYNLTWGNLQCIEHNYDLAYKSYLAALNTLLMDKQDSVSSMVSQCTVVDDLSTTCSNLRDLVEKCLKDFVVNRGVQKNRNQSTANSIDMNDLDFD